MPIPLAIGRLNARVTNRLLWPVVSHLPTFGRVVHLGRKSGREYRTPVNMFRRGDQAVFAMTYGTGTDWLQNVLAAGRCGFEDRSGRLELDTPRVVRDPSRRLVPWPVRLPLRLIRTNEFLVMRIVRASG
jgi:deazaflavin-dependent oxidoreductase (nitroreductase family)